MIQIKHAFDRIEYYELASKNPDFNRSENVKVKSMRIILQVMGRTQSTRILSVVQEVF